MVDPDRRLFRRVAWVNVIGNALKITVEGIVGLAFGSVALLADAAHSVADFVGSLVVLIWGEGAYEGPDSEHPHGHARFEPLTALVVGGTIILMGTALLYESVQGIRFGRTIAFDPALVGALIFAIVLMALIYRYTRSRNRSLDSTALRALAVDCRNDVYTSGAAMIGILGVMAGYPVFDPLAGGFVSLIVIGQGVLIGRENIGYLLGTAPPEAIRLEIRETLLDHSEVAGVHDLVIYYEGADIEVEAHVEVDGDMPLRRAHEIESELVASVEALGGIGDVHVHLDPSGIGEWKSASDLTSG